MDLSIIWYAEVNHNITEDFLKSILIFDCQLRFARDPKISFVIERKHFRHHLLNF